MSILIRTWHLANGLKVEIFDDTVSYYGDYSTVKLVISCFVEVREEYVAGLTQDPRYARVMEALGRKAEYRREITKGGVPGSNIAGVKAFLVERFEENALGYFERDDFSGSFVRKRFADIAEELSKKDRARDGA